MFYKFAILEDCNSLTKGSSCRHNIVRIKPVCEINHRVIGLVQCIAYSGSVIIYRSFIMSILFNFFNTAASVTVE